MNMTPQEDWRKVFGETYDDNMQGGSSRWKISPLTMEALIVIWIEQAVASERSRLAGEIRKKIEESHDPRTCICKSLCDWHYVNTKHKGLEDAAKLVEGKG